MNDGPRPAFVGRHELDVVEAAWTAVDNGSRQVIFIGAESGAGKSRLATEVALELHRLGAAVLIGGCEAELAPPYQPFEDPVEVLRTAIMDRALPVENLEDWPREMVAERLGTIVGRRRAEDRDPAPVDERREMYTSLVAAMRAACAEQPVVLLLEDLHWAAVLGELPSLQRARHHEQVATVLEEQSGRVEQLAHHFAAAHLLGHTEKAVHYLVAAARDAARGLAYAEAGRLLERAVSLEREQAQRQEHQMAAARMYHLACDFDRAQHLFRQIATQGDERLRLRAATAYEDTAWFIEGSGPGRGDRIPPRDGGHRYGGSRAPSGA